MPKKKVNTQPKRRRVEFSFPAGNASEVRLLGDFNQWDATKHTLKKTDNGLWKKTVMLPPGTYEYKFMVDGHWQNDPQNGETCLNIYGTQNNLIRIR